METRVGLKYFVNGCRFIIGVLLRSIKPSSKPSTDTLKLVYRQIENYNFKAQYFPTIQVLYHTTYLSVWNNQTATGKINK